MKNINIHKLSLIASFSFLILGCHKDQEPNKIIYTLPINSTLTVIPAHAAQEFLLIQTAAAQTIVPIINRIGSTSTSYPELSGPDGSSRYTFTKTESHYGTATFLIQFRDSSNAVIDPIQTQSSTTTLKSVVVTVTGTSNRFSASANLIISLDTAGLAESTKRITGTAAFTGSTYSLNFTILASGITCSFDGLTAGSFEASGSGGPQNTNTAILLSLSSNKDANGSISWEGQSGGLHLESNGTGFVTTNQYLIPIQ